MMDPLNAIVKGIQNLAPTHRRTFTNIDFSCFPGPFRAIHVIA
jgi:hypothetical protein